MLKMIGLLMRPNVLVNGHKISEQAIDDLIAKQPVVPVTVNFNSDPIGHTIEFVKDDVGVLCRFEIEDKFDDNVIGAMSIFLTHVVPGFKIKKDQLKGEVINQFTLTEVSLTMHPADSQLTKIEEEKK